MVQTDAVESRHGVSAGVLRPRSTAAFLPAIELALVRGALALLVRLGPVSASNIMGWLFRTLGPALPVTRVAEANLRAALPELDAAARRRILRDMWENLGRTAGEFPHVADLPRDSATGPGWTMVNDHILAAQAEKGGPAIFVSGHIGNWEVLPPGVAAYGMPFSSVYRAASNTALNDIILALRRRALRRNVPMFPKGAQGARDALMHLRRGGYLGMLVDQKMNDGIEARLFGLPAMTAPAAAALALRFHCPIIPGHVERVGPARFRLVVDDPLPLPDSGDRQADVRALTQMINDRLERWIRERPAAWLWLHRRFPRSVTRNAA
jgi:KDO2-lipid IV(A) lauroyltransferase